MKVAAEIMRYGSGDPCFRMNDAEFLAMLKSQRRRVVILAGQILAAVDDLDRPPVPKMESEAAHG